MARKDDFTYDIKDVIKVSGDDDGWQKSILEVQWGDKPISIDFRRVNLEKMAMGKGISFTYEEADTIVDLLLEKGFGSKEAINEAYKRRNFKIEDSDE